MRALDEKPTVLDADYMHIGGDRFAVVIFDHRQTTENGRVDAGLSTNVEAFARVIVVSAPKSQAVTPGGNEALASCPQTPTLAADRATTSALVTTKPDQAERAIARVKDRPSGDDRAR